MKGLFGWDISEGEKPKSAKSSHERMKNPMIHLLGPYRDPEKKCKDCEFLFYKQFSRRYYKCMKRKESNGPATDHRKYWPACSKFEENKSKGIKGYYRR